MGPEGLPYSDKPHPVFGNKSHGGSGWGAYPPAEDDAAWRQIDRHARWLGFDWNRVELEQRIYEPERGQFSWDNPEMRILYRILDWCQKNKADVFLQQMWGNVRWNTFPQWRDDPVGRVHSGPVSMEDFSAGLARLAGYRFVLCEVSHPGRIARGKTLTIDTKWSNVGVGKLYRRYPLVLYLLDTSGTVVCHERQTHIDPTGWLPGNAKAKASLRVPAAVPAGQYTVGMAFVDPITEKPALHLAIEAPHSDRIYRLTQVSVE